MRRDAFPRTTIAIAKIRYHSQSILFGASQISLFSQASQGYLKKFVLLRILLLTCFIFTLRQYTQIVANKVLVTSLHLTDMTTLVVDGCNALKLLLREACPVGAFRVFQKPEEVGR